jgi:hypothetical protein
MLKKAELERLQREKELLVLQSDANRVLLATGWQRLRSPKNWMNEAGDVASRHPIWTTVLAAAAGSLVVKSLRKSGSVLGGIGRLGELASAALSVWRLFRGKKSEE